MWRGNNRSWSGGFDAGVHISEEAVNANVAVPWAIVTVTAIGCTLGFALQICVAFCMGPDTISILSDPIGQPLATVRTHLQKLNGLDSTPHNRYFTIVLTETRLSPCGRSSSSRCELDQDRAIFVTYDDCPGGWQVQA